MRKTVSDIQASSSGQSISSEGSDCMYIMWRNHCTNDDFQMKCKGLQILKDCQPLERNLRREPHMAGFVEAPRWPLPARWTCKNPPRISFVSLERSETNGEQADFALMI